MTAEEWVQRGKELLEEFSYSAAEEAFQHALGIDPQKTQAWNRLAISFSNQGKIEEAEETKSGARLPFQLEIPEWGW